MLEEVEVIFTKDGLLKRYPKGTTYYEISKDRAHLFDGEILAVKVNNHVHELSGTPDDTVHIEFLDLSTKTGNDIYEKGIIALFVSAAKTVLGNDLIVKVENSIDKGIYIKVENVLLDESILNELELAMHQLSRENIRFKKVSVSRNDAITYFTKNNRMDKVHNLKYISNTYINLYKFNNVYDYFYSKMPYSSKALNRFKLNYIDETGLVLSYPTIYNPTDVKTYTHHEKLFEKFNEYTKWGKIVNVSNAADLNKVLSNGEIGDLIRISESFAESTLMNICGTISEKRDVLKLILLGGPSSSGKTTTSKKLAMYLKSKGLRPIPISIDDYFHDRENTPKDANGNFDFESLRAVDVEMFNVHLNKLLNGEEVKTPTYNFIAGTKEFITEPLKLNDNDILIIEGLHALNKNLTATVDPMYKFKMYISPLTQMNIDNNNRVHTTDVRLLRRLIRDNRYRGHSPSVTLKLWKDVRRGEEKFVFPFQDEADIIYNSALIYEIGILKTYVEPLLFSVPRTDENYLEALRLINFLRNFLPIPSDEIPRDSILREFIGGSCFREKK